MPGFTHEGPYPNEKAFYSGGQMVCLKWISQAAGVLPAVGFPGTIAGGWLQAGGGAVASISRTGTGQYTITFSDAWVDLVKFVGWAKQAAAYANTGACDVFITADNSAVAGTQTIIVQVTNGSGTAVDPAVNDVICLHFEFQSFNAN